MKKWTFAGFIIMASIFCVGWLDQPSHYTRTTITHKVVGGDSIWSICDECFDQQNRYSSLDEFVFYTRKENNLLGSKFIQPGQEIKINLYKRKGVVECLVN